MTSNSSWLEPKVLVPSGVAVAAVLTLVLVLLFGGNSGNSVGSASQASSTTSSVNTATTGPEGNDPAGSDSVAVPTSVPPGPYTTPTMPVQVEVPESSNGAPQTEGAVDGQAITVHGSPEPGSKLYGVEARLCRGDVAVTNDGMFTPTLGGACIDKPLSAISDSKVVVAGVEPFEGLDVTFRVGVGSTTFRTQYDGPTTITCGASSPCQIVLKLQYPKGFGFKGIPVTYR